MGRYKSVRVNGESVKLHHKIWEEANGPIMPGYEIHHIDGDGNNNDLSNLQLLTHQEHMALHAKMRAEGTDPVQDVMPGVIRHRQQVKESRLRHIDKRKAYDKRRREEHREERCAYAKSYREQHQEEIARRTKQYRQEHAEELKARAAKNACRTA